MNPGLHDVYEYRDGGGALRRFKIVFVPTPQRTFYRGRYFGTGKLTRPLGGLQLAKMTRVANETPSAPELDAPKPIPQPAAVDFVVAFANGTGKAFDNITDALEHMRRRGLGSATYRVRDRELMGVCLTPSARGQVPAYPEVVL